MASRTITRLYDNHTEAVTAVQALEAAGFDHDHVSILSNHEGHGVRIGSAEDDAVNEPVHAAPVHDDHRAEGAGIGASLGTVLGGGLGLLAGIGLLAIPGLGPVVAAGWIVATISGAGIGAAVGGSAGGIVTILLHAGESEEDAHVYAEGVRRGGSLVTVRADDETRLETAERILLEVGAFVDPTDKRREFAESGWTRFEPQPHA